MPYNCTICQATLPDPPWFRKDVCPKCDADLHACNQCNFYDPALYNECRETQAERVTDKERSNTCDYFRPKTSAKGEEVSARDAARAELDKLFKK